MSDFFRGETPLHKAVLAKNYSLIVTLLVQGHSFHASNAWGFTPLDLARYLGDKKSLRLFQADRVRNIKVLPEGAQEIKKFNPASFKAFFGVNYLSYLLFPDYTFFKATLRKCPWLIEKTAWGLDHKELALKFSHELSEGLIAPVAIQWVNEELGYGLFATQDLIMGTFIGEFTGLVRPLNAFYPPQNAYCFHYPTKFFSWDYMAIDALYDGNEMRFINHSDNPNLDVVCLCEKKLLHIVFIAKHFIKAGTQLTYSYGRDFWRHRHKIKI